MMDEHALIPFRDIEYYRRNFHDLAIWEPYVREVIHCMGVSVCRTIRSTLPGTYPVFNVDDRFVVKFFGSLFDGGRIFEVEAAANRMIEGLQGIDTPRVLFDGALFENKAEWPWPYLVFEFFPGVSGNVNHQVTVASKHGLASQLGRWVRKLHALALPTDGPLKDDQDAWTTFLATQISGCKRRHEEWKSLPTGLIDQIDSYLPSLDYLIEISGPLVLTHTDLTCDHILGVLEADSWTTTGLIDFGDARSASRFYEIPVLFFSLFKCDRNLMESFLRAYGPTLFETEDFPRIALSYALLHQYDVFTQLFDDVPQASMVCSLEELANMLFYFMP